MVSLVLLAAIVVTGAGVRLTGSGLGCTDWPRCTDETFTPSSDLHANIEFWNRMITGLVSAAVVAAVLGSLRRFLPARPHVAVARPGGRGARPDRARRHRRAHPPQPVARAGALRAVDGAGGERHGPHPPRLGRPTAPRSARS
ncbi:MAG: COX15/CtaA family protein [Acidimicrobiales bacterium]